MTPEIQLPKRRLAHPLGWLLMVSLLFSASGATCQRTILVNPFAPAGPTAPQVLLEGASREQIIAAINQNSSRVQSITSTNASIAIPDMLGLPLLSGNIAAERPGRFRLTAGTIAGQEIDIGSNDQLFWMWVRRNQPPAVYFCRHSQFANSNIRQFMPVEPSWLLAALGMVDLDPNNVFDGPLPSARGPGTRELRSWMPSASGRLQRITVVDARTAEVLEQHIYDQAGTTLLASAVTEVRHYYPVEQVSLPERVAIQLPTANMRLTINLGNVQINQMTVDRQQLWTMPTPDGVPQYDLGNAVPGTPLPGQSSASPPPWSGVAPTSYSTYPTTPYPVTPAYSPNVPAGGSTVASPPGPLPMYGQRLPATAPSYSR